MKISTRAAVLIAALLWSVAPSDANAQGLCEAPSAVCDARAAVFIVSAFEPLASAVRISPTTLVTNRHVVADVEEVTIFRADGPVVTGRVVPTGYDGDLVLVESEDLGEGPVLEPYGDVTSSTVLYTVAGDVSARVVQVYAPGRLLLAPAGEAERARLHHSAYSQFGNSGGALVDQNGRFVGIIASGGEGRFEAMQALDLAALTQQSGPEFADESLRIGAATRACVEGMEHRGPIADFMVEDLAGFCLASANRQLFDLAAQTLARSRHFDAAIALLNSALVRDPHALNARVALVVTLHSLRHYEEEIPHLRFLLEHVANDRRLLFLAIQTGKWTDEVALAEDAAALIEEHHPEAAAAAKRLLETDLPRPGAAP